MTAVRRTAFTPFSRMNMYNLVNDVGSYPLFLPWCERTEIHSVTDNHMQAKIEISRGILNHAFVTSNSLDPGKSISLELVEGPFKRFSGGWSFQEAEGGSIISFEIDFEFNSRMLGFALSAAFKPVAISLVDAFRNRAFDVYTVQ
jgi:ribosome-associated toxin RatA of RatAB toxin-antitoxin module